MSYRVVVWGPGNVGAPALRTVIRHPELELAGVIVHSAEKAGRDAGDLVGLPETGVITSQDAEAVLAARPNALFYGVNQDFRPLESAEEMQSALRAGINVVTAGLYPLLHPPSADSSVRAAYQAACDEGGASLLASGIDPGYAMDLLPVVLSGVCEEIDEIRIIENFNYATYEVPEAVRTIIGFGSAMEATPAMLLPGVPKSVWGGALHGLAAALELTVDEIREVIERHPLERDVESSNGRLAAGTQGAFRFEVQGLIGGRPRLVVEHVTRIVDDTAPHWPGAGSMGHHQIRITGRPNIVLTLECEDEHGDHAAGGNATAAGRLVGAIPWVCDAPPGLLSGYQLPLLPGVGRVRTD